MFKKILSFLLVISFTACASAPVAQKGLVKPKPFVTPYEYYRHARPAVMTDQDHMVIQKAEEVHSTGEDTKEDHTQAIIIGTLVGVSVIGGTVAGILLAR